MRIALIPVGLDVAPVINKARVCVIRLLLLLAVVTFTSSGCFAKHTYTLSKADLVAQLSSSKTLKSIYCINDKGDKVWLHNLTSRDMTIRPKGHDKNALILKTVAYSNDTLDGVAYNIWLRHKRRYSFNIRDVDSFIIELRGGPYLFSIEQPSPYFNLDSCKRVVRSKNDSILKAYATGTEWIIKLIPKAQSNKDALPIITNVCYNIYFNDNNQLSCGVVQQITKDSIYISSSFNAAMAAKEGKEYTIYKYAIKDISGLRLRKRNNFSVRDVKTVDYNISYEKIDKAVLRNLWWYSFNTYTGEIMYNRSCLDDGFFTGITEQDGHPAFAIRNEE